MTGGARNCEDQLSWNQRFTKRKVGTYLRAPTGQEGKCVPSFRERVIVDQRETGDTEEGPGQDIVRISGGCARARLKRKP